MPKFTFKDGFDLGAIMQALGVTAAFEPGVANLSGIDGRMDLYVQDAVHQAWITVDEQGAEAAAATGIAVGGNAVEAPPSLIADHSFAYGIYDSVTGSVLFLGRMVDPSQAQPQ
jgi:serpin B